MAMERMGHGDALCAPVGQRSRCCPCKSGPCECRSASGLMYRDPATEKSADHKVYRNGLAYR